jgi:hypothetical protein
MKKLITLSLALAFVLPLFAQDSTQAITTSPKPKKKDWSKINLANRPNDHFMLQLGYNGWTGLPDTVNTKGIPRSFNMYFMFDFPFKTNPRFSVGIGVGVGSDNFYLDKMTVDISGRTNNSSTLSFRNVADTNYFKKYKIATTFLEVPIELRFAANPENTNKSWKAAIGGKVGLLAGAGIKGRTLLSRNGGTISSVTVKEKSKRYFNGTRLSVTGRISKGIFGIYGTYQVNQFIKDGAGPDIRPFQIGLTISGL